MEGSAPTLHNHMQRCSVNFIFSTASFVNSVTCIHNLLWEAEVWFYVLHSRSTNDWKSQHSHWMWEAKTNVMSDFILSVIF